MYPAASRQPRNLTVVYRSAASSALPLGTPQPVTASNPARASYPFPGCGCEALFPEVISVQPAEPMVPPGAA